MGSFQLARPGEARSTVLPAGAAHLPIPTILEALWNTVSLRRCAPVIALVIGVLLSWLIARTDLPWKKALEFVFWISFFLPPLPVTLGWILLLDGKFGLLNQWLQNLSIISGPIFNIYSYWGIVWVHMTTSLGVKVLLLAPAFRNLDASLEESARSCGAQSGRYAGSHCHPAHDAGDIGVDGVGIDPLHGSFRDRAVVWACPSACSSIRQKSATWSPMSRRSMRAATHLGSIFLVLLLILVALQRSYLGQRLYRNVSGRGFSTTPTSLAAGAGRFSRRWL